MNWIKWRPGEYSILKIKWNIFRTEWSSVENVAGESDNIKTWKLDLPSRIVMDDFTDVVVQRPYWNRFKKKEMGCEVVERKHDIMRVKDIDL